MTHAVNYSTGALIKLLRMLITHLEPDSNYSECELLNWSLNNLIKITPGTYDSSEA